MRGDASVEKVDEQDQVIRRREFERANPGVRIEFRPPLWHAQFGDEEITRLHLRWLLDALELRPGATEALRRLGGGG
jgi:hypothetical protein